MLFRQFCLPDQFEVRQHEGELPTVPVREHYVFRMEGGTAADPKPLFGACIRTEEVLYSTRNSNLAQLHFVAPRCYCLFSRYALFDSLFAVLNAALRVERAERTNTCRVKAPLPAMLAQQQSVRYAHVDMLFDVIVPQGATGGELLDIEIPSLWRHRDAEGSVSLGTLVSLADLQATPLPSIGEMLHVALAGDEPEMGASC